MEKTLYELFEILDKNYPAPTQADKIPSEFSNIISYAIKNNLVDNSDYPQLTISSSAGLSILNQMKLKKSVDELNESIKNFDKSSTRLSRIMLVLTGVYTLLTFIMIVKMIWF